MIALGNVRLFEEVQAKTRDLTESLQQETATADVLKIIAALPSISGRFSTRWSRRWRASAAQARRRCSGGEMINFT